MKSLVTFLTLILSLTISTKISAQKKTSAKASKVKIEKFNPNRDAAQDIKDAVKEATKTHKRIILDVGGEWCIWCHRLDALFVKNPGLFKYMNEHFVYVKINYSKENKNEKVLSKFPKIPGYPHWFLLDSDGSLLLSKSSGDFESGKGHDPKIVMAFLKKWTIKSKS